MNTKIVIVAVLMAPALIGIFSLTTSTMATYAQRKEGFASGIEDY
jgi:hypothetical protein